MFLVVWEFEVKPECEERFQQAYDAGGDWVQLFATDANFEQSVLVKGHSRAHLYLTLDFWHSRQAYESFKQSKQEAYQSLDRACQGLTVAERYIGAFEQV